MITYSMRNDRNTDDVFVKQLHLLFDFIKQQRDDLADVQSGQDVEPDDDGYEFPDIDELKVDLKAALIDFLAETIGWTTDFSNLVETATGDGSESGGEDFIRELFRDCD